MTKREDANEIASAAAQLRRVLLALAKLDDDKAHPLSEVAEAAGTDEATLLRDLRTLVDREGHEPAGFIEAVSLAVDATSVRLEAPRFFRRPMGLTATELHALELGLATLGQESPPEERGTIDRARLRLRQAIAGLPAEPVPDTSVAAHIGAEAEERKAIRKRLQQCITTHCVAELRYQRPQDTEAAWRNVRPIGFVFARGSWYLVAFATPEADVRVFRFDRIAEVRPTKETFAAPAAFPLGDVVHDGRVMTSEQQRTVQVRYGPRIARWIAEREEVAPSADGSVTVDHPLADPEWAVRHVLQYGGDAEVIAPAEVREMVREQLEGMSKG